MGFPRILDSESWVGAVHVRPQKKHHPLPLPPKSTAILQLSLRSPHQLGALTILGLLMVAGCSNSVSIFQVTWFRMRTWRGQVGGQSGRASEWWAMSRAWVPHPPFHHSCRSPGTGCWGSRPLT